MNDLRAATTRRAIPGATSHGPGFSLIEVVVALAVAASLGLAYIGVQQRSIAYVEDVADRMEHIRIAQAYLIENPFFTTHVPTPDWVGFDSDKQWRIETDLDEDTVHVRLMTRYQESTMSWEWIAP